MIHKRADRHGNALPERVLTFRNSHHSGHVPSVSLYDLTYEDVAHLVGDSRAETVFMHLYRPPCCISSEVERRCRELGITVRSLKRMQIQRDGTAVKYLFGLSDGAAIESVRLKRQDGYTACVSVQVGCAFGCRFCASGRLGLMRQLSAGEIVQQVLELGPGVNRIVFMGTGEPLHNYDAVLGAIRILRDRRGRGFRTSGITISTVGVPDGLRRLREEHLKINLTISLHATDQSTRDHIIPGARRHDISHVVGLSQSWAKRHNRRVTYGYLLLPGINNRCTDIERLAEWFAKQPARINLMRMNPVKGVSLSRTDDRSLICFMNGLRMRGVDTTVRDARGCSIGAACGQLWLRMTEHGGGGG